MPLNKETNATNSFDDFIFIQKIFNRFISIFNTLKKGIISPLAMV